MIKYSYLCEKVIVLTNWNEIILHLEIREIIAESLKTVLRHMLTAAADLQNRAFHGTTTRTNACKSDILLGKYKLIYIIGWLYHKLIFSPL